MGNEEHLARLQQGVKAWNMWRNENLKIKPDLRQANFTGADLAGADLCQADLTGALIEKTIFGDLDLNMVQGLDVVMHLRPSTIGIDTLYHSHGNIPEVFLRGAGVPDEMIAYSKSLVGQPFQYYSCFISYSGRDNALAQRLHADLQDIGDEFWSRIDESIQVYDRLLLILSEDSVKGRGVQVVGWAADIRRQRHIGNFLQWKDHDAYQKAFQRLLRDLKSDI